MKKIILLLLLSGTILSCQNELSAGSKPELDEEFTIQNGEQVMIQGKDITVTFVEVLRDSRCPTGVECVWSGNAEVAVYINDELITLNTHIKPQQIVISGYQIKLVKLTPYPHINKKIDPEDYAATLVISEK